MPQRASHISWEVSLGSEDRVSRVAELVSEQGIITLNVAHRHNGLQELRHALKLKHLIPDLTLIPHLSVRRLSHGSLRHKGELCTWFEEAQKLQPPHILIISGTPRSEFDSLWALEASAACNVDLPFAVAYNPFLNTPEEENRLQVKLSDPRVKAVYLQIGENPATLLSASKLIRELRPDVTVFGCLLLPTKFIRHHLQNTSWHGVTLSQDYLNYPIYAWEITHVIARLFRQHNIVPLIEGLPFDSQTFNEYERFLSEPFLTGTVNGITVGDVSADTKASGQLQKDTLYNGPVGPDQTYP